MTTTTDKICKVIFYSIPYKMITFTFLSQSLILSFLKSVIHQPYTSRHKRLTCKLEVKWQEFLNIFCRMQLSPTVATSAITRAQELLISRDISGNIQERSLSNAINVTTPADQLLTSRNTCGNIRERGLSSAINVATLAQKLEASRRTS